MKMASVSCFLFSAIKNFHTVAFVTHTSPGGFNTEAARQVTLAAE
jgi:hypothetical protein